MPPKPKPTPGTKPTTPAAVYTLPDNTPIVMVSVKGERVRVERMTYGEGRMIPPQRNGWRNQMFHPDHCSYKATEE